MGGLAQVQKIQFNGGRTGTRGKQIKRQGYCLCGRDQEKTRDGTNSKKGKQLPLLQMNCPVDQTSSLMKPMWRHIQGSPGELPSHEITK